MFSRLLAFPDHVTSWRASASETSDLPQGDEILAVSDELSDSARTLGRALQNTFTREASAHLRDALTETAAVRRTCGFTYASHPDLGQPAGRARSFDGLQALVAPEALPASQRRDMIRCMFGILFAAGGSPVVALDQFGDSERTSGLSTSEYEEEDSTEILERLAADLGSPDSPLFDGWSDAVELLRVRESLAALRDEASNEHVVDTVENGIALLRGDVNAPDSGLILALANPTSEVVEVNVDRRTLGGATPVVMRECISGDTVYIPQAGNHVLSIDLEPYEVMWLDLGGEDG